MAGDGALFTREDAVEAAWAVVDPVLVEPSAGACPTRPAAGGPRQADALIAPTAAGTRELRTELGYADYLGACSATASTSSLRQPRSARAAADVELPRRLSVRRAAVPGALEVIAHLGALGPTVILSDGDVVFQPRKVQRSGLWDAVEGRVLIYIHKEQMLDEVVQRLSGPALRHGRRQAAHPGGDEEVLWASA
jgi:hypothetical protein